MRTTGLLLVAMAVSASTAAPPAISQTGTADPSLQERVDTLDAYLSGLAEMNAFDGAVLVAKGEDVLLAKGYGLADREAGRSWTPETASTIGSLTKQFTGAAITLLVQRGDIEFTDTIGDYFPDAPEDKAGITIHELLTHTSGLPGAIGEDEEQVGRDQYLQRVWKTEFTFPPGDRFGYSNVGYSVLAAIIEMISGAPYEVFLRDNLFGPAGMTKTGYVLPAWDPERLAVGYREEGRWGTVVDHQSEDGFSWHLVGNGGIHSTVADMHRWWLAIRNNTVLDEEHTKVYLAPHQDDGRGDFFYSYGWANFTAPNGERLVSHNGSNGFLGADCGFYPESDVFVFLLTNDVRKTRTYWAPIIRSVAGGDLPLPPDMAEVDVDTLR